MIKNTELFAKELEKTNEWWVTGKIKLKENLLERDILNQVIEEIENRRIVQITGPRRAGKTVAIKQTIANLIEKGIEHRNILYYSLDDPSLYIFSDNLIKDILDYFLENIAKKGRKYIFFDEIHTFPKWYQWLKSFFDRYEDIKFIVLGSSSLTLQTEANQFLRGRTIDIEILPFSFHEFLEFSGIKIKKKRLEEWFPIEKIEIRKIENSVLEKFNEFLLVGGFPEWFETKSVEEWFQKIINDVPKKAVYEDVSNIFGIKTPKILENIFSFIVSNQSRILSYEKINEVAMLNRATLLNYIEYLKNSYLIIEIPKFTESIKEQIKSMKKFLVIDQGIRNAVMKDYELKPDNIGFVIENVVGAGLSHFKLFYFRTDGEIDFVIKKDSSIIPIEVKYSNVPTMSRTFLNFLEKNPCKTGVIVTKNTFKIEEVKEKKIFFVPAWAILLTHL